MPTTVTKTISKKTAAEKRAFAKDIVFHAFCSKREFKCMYPDGKDAFPCTRSEYKAEFEELNAKPSTYALAYDAICTLRNDPLTHPLIAARLNYHIYKQNTSLIEGRICQSMQR